MEHSKRRGGWLLVVGMVVGALIVPRVATAVGSIVTIQGGGSTEKAAVTKGKQLQTTEAAPNTFRAFQSTTGQTACAVVATMPDNKGYVVKTVTLTITGAPGSGLPLMIVYPNASCTGDDGIAVAATDKNGVITFPIEPGFGMAHGGKMSVKVLNTVSVVVSVFGYVVPSGDVPITTPIA